MIKLEFTFQAANLYIQDSSSQVIDVENPNLIKFPKFADAMKCCIQLVLKPGDMLFIPGEWGRLGKIGDITHRPSLVYPIQKQPCGHIMCVH